MHRGRFASWVAAAVGYLVGFFVAEGMVSPDNDSIVVQWCCIGFGFICAALFLVAMASFCMWLEGRE